MCEAPFSTIRKGRACVADTPLRVFAFDALAAAHEGPVLVSRGVILAPRHPYTMLDLCGDPGNAEFMREASAALGLVLPVKPSTVAATEHLRALWLGPDEWLLVCAEEAPAMPQHAIANGTFTDLSSARAVLRLSGRASRATLAKVCSLDLDPREFAVDDCAQTALAKVNVILDHVAPGTFDVYCARSYAGSLWRSLMEAAAEYGCDVVQPA